ncbi:hypothetical protein WJX74_000869 [Apatococcus lobatus]|uniref:hydroxyethylthiazole kinase n=1 Tax=Apatococcus lobatus TaxID=904363 RepID=A0AAW1RKC1_9CHLO
MDPTRAWELWQKVRHQKPLVQCITNFVSMDIMANTLLAAGASPAMAHSAQEVEDFSKLASALLVNVGTLTPDWTDGMQLAAKAAKQNGKPWVLDPVGAGATPFRTKVIMDLVKLQPTMIRGNASEIMAVAGAAVQTRGVDTSAEVSDALQHAQQLARDLGCIVAVSGAVDKVTDGKRTLSVRNGVEMLTYITAAGCSVTALAAAFISAEPEDPLFATAAALSIFGLSAELGALGSGPGSLRVGMMDKLFNMTWHEAAGQGTTWQSQGLHITEDAL